MIDSSYPWLFALSLRSLQKKKLGGGEIRTQASEETGALNQRLRPLGHATGYRVPYFITRTYWLLSISHKEEICQKILKDKRRMINKAQPCHLSQLMKK